MPNVELKRGQEVKEDAFEIRRRVFMEEQGSRVGMASWDTRASAKSTTKTKASRTFGWKRPSRAPSNNTPCRSHPHSERFLGVAALAPG